VKDLGENLSPFLHLCCTGLPLIELV